MSEAAGTPESDGAIGRAPAFGRFERTLAWRYLRAKRENGGVALVSIISFIGIALAVTALVVVMSVMNGFRGELVDALLSGRGHVFVEARYMSEEEADAVGKIVATIDDVESVIPIVEAQAFATSARASTGIFVRGLPPEDARHLDFIRERMVMGSAERFGETDGNGLAKHILIADGVARMLRVTPGDTIKVISSAPRQTAMGTTPRQATFEVIGVFKTGYGEIDQVFTLMPMETVQAFFEFRGRYQNLELRIADPDQSEKVIEEIGRLVPIAGTTDWKRQNPGILNALTIESTMMRVIFIILLTITSLNIITGVVMLVKNKTRDVAILRTIGTSQGSVLRVFLMIGAFLGIMGTAVGLALGLTIIWNLSHIENFFNTIFNTQIFDPSVYGITLGEIARINWWEVGFASVWAIATSVLVTLAPAMRAAKLDPVEALRFE